MKYEEFMEKYGDIKVKFKSYYKYSFTFEPVFSNTGIVYVTVGGSHDDIYRFDLEAEKTYAIKALEPSFVKLEDGHYHNFDW